MKTALLFFLFFLEICSASGRTSGENYRIFGEVTTVDNQTYSGYITWGNRKMFWTDLFRATKLTNPYAVYFKNSGITFPVNGNRQDTPPTHLFECRFGDIKSVRLTYYDKIELTIRDGNTIELVKGADSDIGSMLTVQPADNDCISLKWDKISNIEFKAIPENMAASSSNQPITGIIQTNQGLYKGLITWDMEEKTLDALLDGRTRNGERSIAFRHIQKIIKNTNGCQVIYKDGKTEDMWGSHDVNNQNRGIAVSMPNTGNVIIPWSNFESFEAVPLSEIQGLSYENFPSPQRLSATIKLRNKERIQGIIAYDLDESMNFEILDGKNDNITYCIPFRYVRSIEPKNYKYSFVTLKNGSSLSLGETQDLDAANSGILLFSADPVPLYIPWKEIESITF